MRLYITLDRVEAERLTEVARQERRRPKDQAAYLIVRGLEREPNRDPDTALRTAQ
jgi:hypothetical protein